MDRPNSLDVPRRSLNLGPPALWTASWRGGTALATTEFRQVAVPWASPGRLGGPGRMAGGDLSTSPLWAAHLTGWPRKPNVRFKDLPNPWKTPTRSSTSTRGARLSSRGQAARGGGVGRQDDRSAQRPAALKRGGTRKKKQPTRTTRLRPESKHGEVGRGLD